MENFCCLNREIRGLYSAKSQSLLSKAKQNQKGMWLSKYPVGGYKMEEKIPRRLEEAVLYKNKKGENNYK